MLRLGEIRKAKGSNKNTKRLGRGPGSGQGKTAGKGHKGQQARAGGRVRLGFEGGQMPLYRRVPKKGFTNVFRQEFAIINLDKISQLSLKEISLETLKKEGALKTALKKLKILATGEVTKALTFKVHAISAAAKAKIEKAGGTVEVLK